MRLPAHNTLSVMPFVRKSSGFLLWKRDHPMKTFFAEVYCSFLRTHGYSVGILSFIMTTLAFYFTPDDTVHLKWLVPLSLVSLLVFIVLVDFAFRAYHAATTRLPVVKSATKPPELYPNATALLLLDKSELFGHESIVSVYIRDNDFEMLIGVGFVLTIQQDGLVQILVSKKVESGRDMLWTEVTSNNANTLRKLIVKPSIPKHINDIGA